MKSLNEAWQQLAQRIPRDAGGSQRRDMELAFYGGASALADILDGIVSMEDDATRIQTAKAVNSELSNFRIRMLTDVLESLFISQPTPREPHSRATHSR